MEIWEKIKTEWNRVFQGTEHESTAETSDELLDQLENTPQMKELLQSVSQKANDETTEAFNTQVQAIEDSFSEQKDEVNDLAGKVTALEQSITELKDSLKGTEGGLENFQTELNEVKKNVAELKGTETKPADRKSIPDSKKEEEGEDEPIKMSFNEFRYGNGQPKK